MVSPDAAASRSCRRRRFRRRRLRRRLDRPWISPAPRRHAHRRVDLCRGRFRLRRLLGGDGLSLRVARRRKPRRWVTFRCAGSLSRYKRKAAIRHIDIARRALAFSHLRFPHPYGHTSLTRPVWSGRQIFREGEKMRLPLCVLVGMVCLALLAHRASAAAVVVPAGSTVSGKTIGEWTADWWNWTGSVDNVFADTTGAAATQNQSGPVFFLAGTQGGAPVTR